MKEFSINNYIKIKLTEEGKRILRSIYAKSLTNNSKMSKLWNELKYLNVDENGYATMEMWEVMKIFGKYLYNGNKDFPFDMTILIPNEFLRDKSENQIQETKNKMKEFNINNYIKIMLTEEITKILESRFNKLEKEYKDNPKARKLLNKWKYPKYDKNGYAEMQMWEFMQVFGEYTQTGNKKIPYYMSILIPNEFLGDYEQENYSQFRR